MRLETIIDCLIEKVNVMYDILYNLKQLKMPLCIEFVKYAYLHCI